MMTLPQCLALNAAALAQAVAQLGAGQCVGLPTETVYGLAADAFNADAVLKIFALKQRPSFDPLIVHVADSTQLAQVVAEVTPLARRLIATFWPGPLTLLLPKQPSVPDVVTSGLPQVAVRCPAHPVAQAVLRAFGPLAAPSANRFGRISPTTALHVAAEFPETDLLILDGGPCNHGVESTIVEPLADGGLNLLRLGSVTTEALAACVGEGRLRQVDHAEKIRAPGQLKSHYAPRRPLYIVEGGLAALPAIAPQGSMALAFQTLPPGWPGVCLSPTGDLVLAARQIFAALRTLDDGSAAPIYAEYAPDHGLGRAINDRLWKAATGLAHLTTHGLQHLPK